MLYVCCSPPTYLSFLDTYLSQPPRADIQLDPSGPAEKTEICSPLECPSKALRKPFEAPPINQGGMAPGRR